MIDYIKAYTYNKSAANNLINSVCNNAIVNVQTGEVSKYLGDCACIKVIAYPSGRIQFKGSFHKYYAHGENWTDYTIIQFKQTVFSFCQLLGIDAQRVYLENVEFGVNIELPYSPKIVLDHVICLTNGATFTPQKGEGLACHRIEYRIKIYNKGNQFPFRAINTLRFEIHVDKMRKISPVKTLQDLTNPIFWDAFRVKLVNHLRKIIFTDNYYEECLSRPQLKDLYLNRNRYNNANDWKRSAPYQRTRKHIRLIELQDHAQYKFNLTISKLINLKVFQLLSRNNFPVNLLSENVA